MSKRQFGQSKTFSPHKAIFLRAFHWQRPGARFGFGAFPSAYPQRFPRDFIAAAIRAGAAVPVTARSGHPSTAADAADPQELRHGKGDDTKL